MTRLEAETLNNSLKARLSALQQYAGRMQSNIGFVMLLEDGEWSACRGGGRTEVFPTEAAAEKFLTGCNPIIVIDV